MNFAISIACMCAVIVYTEAQTSKTGNCFGFKGDSYLKFSPNNFNNSNAIHYTFKFRTIEENVILLYARDQQGDDEALFIRSGKLRYHLFNSSPTGIEGYYGAYLEGDETVSTGEWITVNVYRIWPEYDTKQRRMRRKTGFDVEIEGDIYPHVDYLERSDITLSPEIYIGGYGHPLSATLTNFKGQIKDIYEEKNDLTFETPSYNSNSKVELYCTPDPVEPN